MAAVHLRALRQVQEETTSTLRALAQQFSSGTLSAAHFGDLMAETLEEAHTQAVVLGRQHAGDLAEEEADDRRYAELVVDGESEFLAGFVKDLEEGRYEDKPDALAARAGSYAAKLTSTSTEVWVLASNEDAQFWWRLGPTEQSCGDCPRWAAGGPYRSEELPARPRDGTSACKTGCGCRLQRTDGVEGFGAEA